VFKNGTQIGGIQTYIRAVLEHDGQQACTSRLGVEMHTLAAVDE